METLSKSSTDDSVHYSKDMFLIKVYPVRTGYILTRLVGIIAANRINKFVYYKY